MKTKRDKAELLADKLDIPADALGSVKLSLCGRSRLLIENHRGIITYGDALIEVSCGKVKLIIRGDDLRLKAMTGSDMLICGRIISLEFE
jgi:sporulation protein YqfC